MENWFSRNIKKTVDILIAQGLRELMRKIYGKLAIHLELTIKHKKNHYCVSQDKAVFIFSGVPYYQTGGGQRSAQLAKTFHMMGYAVYYFYVFPSPDQEIKASSKVLVKHLNIRKYSLRQLVKDLRKKSLFIFELPHGLLSPYLRFGKEHRLQMIYEHIDNCESVLSDAFFDRKLMMDFLALPTILTGTSRLRREQLLDYLLDFQIKKEPQDILYSPNAVDLELFNPWGQDYHQPEDLIIGCKTLIYYGTLWGDWIDWELVEHTARLCPDCTFNIIGDFQTITGFSVKLPSNIYFLGVKIQTQLPQYLYFSDIAILPIKNDKVGSYVTPLKIFEYIAMHKTVIATKLPDIQGYPSVLFSNHPEDWARFINGDYPPVDILFFMQQNNWYARMNQLLDQLESRKASQKISVIVLNRNNGDIIATCIDCLLACRERYDYQIILVDNQSSDGSFQLMKNSYGDKITLCENSKNGCSSGRNLGAKLATGEFLVFLDSDQFVISQSWLDNALDILQTNAGIGAVGWTGGWFDQGYVTGPIADDLPGRGMPADGLFRLDMVYLGSGGLVVSAALFQAVSGFDESYDPTCFEDTDFSFKIKERGYQIAYCPYMGLIHLAHRTTLSGTPGHLQLLKKNGDYFQEKWRQLL